jgi:hypothetical protein
MPRFDVGAARGNDVQLERFHEILSSAVAVRARHTHIHTLSHARRGLSPES